MAGDVTVAVVSAQLTSTGGGDTDFTKTDFGTPKACIVLVSFDDVDNTAVATQAITSIGFSDFTNHRCIAHQDEDNSAKVDCDAGKSNSFCYWLINTDATTIVTGTASTITDGVRLTHSAGEADNGFATVIMFGGADLKVSLDSVNTPNGVGNTTVTTTNIDQDLVFFIGSDITGEDSSSSGIENSFGVAHIDTSDHATFVNRCIGWASDHNVTTANPSEILHNDQCLGILTEAGSEDWGIELTGATTTTYTVTERFTSSGANMEFYALALDLDDRGSKIGSVDGPTSGTSWTPSVTLGFTPQYVGLGLSRLASEGGSGSQGVVGISSNTGTGEETCHSWYNEIADTTNTNNLFRSRVIDERNASTSTVQQDHSHSSFNNGGWTYTINTENDTGASKWFYWAIEEAAAAGANQETITATATGVASIQLAVAKTLAVTAVGSSQLNRLVKKQPFTATATGIAAIIVNKIFAPAKIALAATAAGIAVLGRKMRFTLPTSTGGFLMFASQFDGANDYLTRGANLTSISDSKVGLLSFWYNGNEDGASDFVFNSTPTTPSVRFRIIKNSSDNMSLQTSDNTANNLVLTSTGGLATIANGWIHCLFSWDLNTPGRAEVYIDDVDVSSITIGPTDTNVEYSAMTDFSIGASVAGSLKINACLSQIYLNTTETLDLSVVANRRLFINADLSPVDLGPDGSNPTGNVPILYLDKTPANFHLNDGTGGDFVQNGTLTECAPPNGAVAAVARVMKFGLGTVATGIVSIIVTAIGATQIALAATATAIAAVQLKTKKTLASTATGVAVLVDIPTFRIAVAATATGIVTLAKKAKFTLSDTAVGIAVLARKAKLGLSVSVTGVVGLARKVKITLRNTATGVVSIVVNALEGAVLLTLTATATAIAALQITVKKTLGAVSLGVATLDPIATFRVLLAAVGAGIATLTKVATFRQAFSAVATGIAALGKKPKLGLAAVATGIVSINRIIFKTLRSTAEGVATVVLVSAVFIAIAVAAVGIPAIALKTKRGLNAVGSGVARIQRTVRKTLDAIATGLATLNEERPTPPSRLQRIIIGFFGGPGGGPGR